MREILFRGKRKDTGEWVDGFVVNTQCYLRDSLLTIIVTTDSNLYPRGEISCCVEVDPETVGQYTGLKDCNGKRIFEGDIVSMSKYTHCTEDSYKIGVVEWRGSGWEVLDVPLADYAFIGLKTMSTVLLVIGNKWDNPELLKECE